jgi:hypothetical protein
MITLDNALQILGERTNDRLTNERQQQLQRRNAVVDLHGIEYSRQGDTQTPATFYISISPDLIYYQRFEFKIIVDSFAIPVGNGAATSNTVVAVNDTALNLDNTSLNVSNTSLTNGSTSLTVDENNVVSPNPHTHPVNPNPHGHTITPNPHTHVINPNPHNHTTQAHNHILSGGITLTTSSISNFRVSIEDIDITENLIAQYPSWVNGNGVYPADDDSRYDLLKVAGELPAWQRGIILSPGFKRVTMSANGVYNVTLVNYLKYSNMNR